jgi:dimethylargininase
MSVGSLRGPMTSRAGAGASDAARVARRALVREVSESIARGLTTQSLGLPDVARAREQHRAYVVALEALGVRVTSLEVAPELPDSHFLEDVAVVHRGTAILTAPAAPERRAEVERIRPALEAEMSVVDLGGDDSAHLDGGDVLLSGNRVLIGLGTRTNRPGAEALRDRLRALDPSLSFYFVPFAGLLHFKSGISDLRPDLYVGDPKIRLGAPMPGVHVEWLPANEGYGANVLAVNGGALVAASSPTVQALARRELARVIPLDLGEFRKVDGSLTCLSLLW